MEKKIEYKVKHVGINSDNDQEAAKLVQHLSFLFGLEPGPESDTHAFVDGIFEVMKNRRRGKCGHIALQTADVELAMKDLATKGITFKEDTIQRNKEGKITFIYLEQEIGGFAFHLTV